MTSEANMWRGLLWREWGLHRTWLQALLAAWLVGLWIFPLFNTPAWILVLGIVFSVLAAPAMGGLEAAEGSEEFAFSLPVGRGRQYLARLFVGLPALLIFCVTGTLAIRFNLPQKVWSLLVDSGFTVPFRTRTPPAMYAFAVCAPLAVFAVAFVQASLARSYAGVTGSWLLSIAVNGVLFVASAIVETQVWNKVTGYIGCPLLVLVALAVLPIGYFRYRAKEGLSRPVPASRSSGTAVVLVVLVVIALILLVGMSCVKTGRSAAVAVRPSATEARGDGAPDEVRETPQTLRAVIDLDKE